MLSLVHRLYYPLKPFIPRAIQLLVRRRIILRKVASYCKTWPIDASAAKQPDGWAGWPDRKRFALVLTHDIDTAKGVDKCTQLADLEERLGLRSSFHFVAEGYVIPSDLRRCLADRGFEVALHGLKHDASLYQSRETFRKQSIRINNYMREWKCVGFRSPSMYRNLEWIHDLDLEYDASTFDTDPFEPMPHGVATIYPFVVKHPTNHKGYVELPYTLPQDFLLYIMLGHKTIDIWKKKLAWIAENGGMALVLTHPDYMDFGNEKKRGDRYSSALYEEFLTHVTTEYKGQYWQVLPREMARFWSANYYNHT